MAESRRRSGGWRRWLRAFHRDIGYFCIGLTLIYAISGLAVNHIEDWDPNFDNYERTIELPADLPADDRDAAAVVLARLDRAGPPEDVYGVDEGHFDIIVPDATISVDRLRQSALEQGQKPRLLLKTANWLHLNRGKKAWTYVADGYALFLMFLAISGLFMLPGRKGILGRGAAFLLLGVAVPVTYVVLAGR